MGKELGQVPAGATPVAVGGAGVFDQVGQVLVHDRGESYPLVQEDRILAEKPEFDRVIWMQSDVLGP